jgi:hypothetical protein
MKKIIRFEEYDEGLHAEIRKPFPPEYIEWKPQSTPGKDHKGDTGWGLAVPYVDPRWYLERLDALVGPWGWTSKIVPVSASADKVIVELTILGITKMNGGEKDAGDRNTFTSADAQAFKRACVEFGLGRYLYQFIPQTFVSMQKKGRSWRFTDKALTELRQIAEEGTAEYLKSLGEKPMKKKSAPSAPPPSAPPPSPPPPPAPTPSQPTPTAIETLAPSEGLVPELNYEIKASGKAAEYTGITTGKIKLFHLLQAGDDGLGYLRWMSNKTDHNGREYARKVLEWYEAGGQLPDAELDQGPPPAAPQPDAQPPADVDVSKIKDMASLCAALGTKDFNGVWERLKADGVFKSLPRPDEKELWAKAYAHMASLEGQPGAKPHQPEDEIPF